MAIIFWDCRSPLSYAIAMFNSKSRVDFISFYHGYHKCTKWKYTANNINQYEQMPLSVILSTLPSSAIVDIPTLILIVTLSSYSFSFSFRFLFSFLFPFSWYQIETFWIKLKDGSFNVPFCGTNVEILHNVYILDKMKCHNRIWKIGRYWRDYQIKLVQFFKFICHKIKRDQFTHNVQHRLSLNILC